MNFRAAKCYAGFFLLLFAASCTHYYRITDQPTRRTYYTTKYETTDSGAVRFYDQKSLSTVTLQSTEIAEITRAAYEDAIRASKPLK